ncbi:MutS protein msh4 [Penicillium rubens]|nr:MutS protein msh4 [Penicillium rubens]
MKGLLVRSQFPVKPMRISISTGLVIFIQTVGDIFGIVIYTAVYQNSAFWSMCYDYYHGLNDFRSKYSSKYENLPFEGPVLHYRWGIGKEVTPDEYNTYREELKVFQRWFDKKVFSQDPNTLSEAIMIMLYSSANPKYRDIPNESFPVVLDFP